MNSIALSLAKLRIYPNVGELIEKDKKKICLSEGFCISHIDGYDGYIRKVQGSSKFSDIEITGCETLTEETAQYVLVIWGDWNEFLIPYVVSTLKSDGNVKVIGYTNSCGVIEREEGFNASLRFVYEYKEYLNTCDNGICDNC